MTQSKGESRIPTETIKRLGLYLRRLRRLLTSSVETVSSEEITRYLNISSHQFRKDLSYFGPFGRRGVGYKTDQLIVQLEKILGLDSECPIALVGVGKLGSAFLAYTGFSNFNIRIVAAFDNDITKIGKNWEGIRIEDLSRLETIVPELKIKLAVLTVPAEYAQEVGIQLAKSGVKGILNFAPANLNLPGEVLVINVDMAAELMALAYLVQKLDR